MKLAGPYAGWVTHTVWRKKNLIFLLLIIILFILGIQYYSKNISNREDNSFTEVIVKEESKSVSEKSVNFLVDMPINSNSSIDIKKESPRIVRVDEVPYFDYIKKHASSTERSNVKNPFVPKNRLIHFDLKGAPPKVEFLKSVLELSKTLGATGVLLEWEDMFPWSGQLSSLAALNAYSLNQVHEILNTAKRLELEVIPLIQTFGHVEFALKLEKFYSLREVPASSQALCPSLNASMELIEQLIEQIMEVHPEIRYLHIGCDEVFQIGECVRCRNQPRDNLFLGHVVKVAKFVRYRYPNVTPIIWDDMLRHLAPSTLDQYQLGDLVEPMVWVYAEDIYRFVPYSIWDKYAATFPRIWAASAFKGAFGETLIVPNIKRHLENNLRWVEVMVNEGPKFKGGFQGIAITGWQRYDHFSVLCELLPASIPSLAVTLMAISHGFMNPSLQLKLNNYLNCGVFGPTMFNLNADPYFWDAYSRCDFPGHLFFKLTYRLTNAEKETADLIHMIRKRKGWMTEYNIRHNFSTPLRVDELMQEHSRIYNTMLYISKTANDALTDILDQFAIDEWIEQKIYPLILQLEQIQKDAFNLKSRKFWPRRPLPMLRDLQRIGIPVTETEPHPT